MATWKKIDRTENSEGTTITYKLKGMYLLVQSRKRHIPHAVGKLGYNGRSTWDHTSYFVLDNGVEVKECWRLQDAKEYAEKLAAERQGM